MKNMLRGFAVAVVAAGWMFGSWLFMNSIAMGAEEKGPSEKAAVTYSGHHGPGYGDMHCMPFDRHHWGKRLRLTDAQQKQIHAIVEEERAVSAPLVQKMRDGRQRLRDLGKDGKFDEEQVRAAAREQADVMVEMIVARERMHARIYEVLTPEQRAKMDAMHEQKQMKKMHHKGERKRHHAD